MGEVVLHHVPQGPGLFVVAAPASHPGAFGHGDLDALHQVPVPQGLEDGVGKAEDQEVLDRFLAQVVVDAVDLGLVEIAVQQLLIEILGAMPGPGRRASPPPGGSSRGCGSVRPGPGRRWPVRKGVRGQGQVEEAISRELVRLFQGLEAGRQGPVIFGRPRAPGTEKRGTRRTRRRVAPA